MADKIILADTSVLIDLFRKTDKTNSTLIKLVKDGYTFCISAITEYEIYTGATIEQIPFWENLLHKAQVLPFDQSVVKTAITINRSLKKKRKLIDLADLFIASTAVANNIPFVTLNTKHFERIDELEIIR